MSCSVENPNSCNHYVMCYRSEDGLAALAMVQPRTQRRTEQPLDHRVDCLHLPALTISSLVPIETPFHPPPPAARGWFVGRPSPRRWDDGPDSVQSDTAVDPLGVEIRVGQQRTDPRTAESLLEGRLELHEV